MPREQYEQLLADTRDLLEKRQGEDEGGDYGQDDGAEGIDSSEMVVENNEGAMIIQGEDNIDDEQQDDYGDEDLVASDEQQDQLRHGLHAGEINIEGGEQNIIDDDNEEDDG